MSVAWSMSTAIVRCDWTYVPGEGKRCDTEFRSGSLRSVIPLQLAEAGWLLQTTELRDAKRTLRGEVLDLCPKHAALWLQSWGWRVKRGSKSAIARWLRGE